jgi:hypothetical protein
MSDETARLVARLRARLRIATRRLTWAELAFGSAVAVGTLAALWLLAAAVEATLWLSPPIRTALLGLTAAAAFGVAGTFLLRPLGRLLGLLDGPSDKDVARTVGATHPGVADRLVNLLQLADGARSHAPAPYVDRAVNHLAQQVNEVAFAEIADFTPARTAAQWASLPLLAVAAFLLAAPSTFLGASGRLLAPQTAFERPAPFTLSVSPGSAQLVKGDSLRIAVRTTGAVPGSATLLLRPEDAATPRRIALRPDSAGTFRHTVPAVRRPLRYRVVAAPVRTPWYDVEVAQRPFLRQLQLRVTPPSYTERSPRTLAPNVGDVAALPGAEVRVSATLGGAPVAEAALTFANGPAEPVTVRGDTATGRFVVEQPDTYALHLKSPTGVSNRDPIRYDVSAQSDARPSVSFVEPTGTAELTPALTQPLRVQLRDDYGFRRVELFYRRAGTEAPFSSLRLPLSAPRQTDQVLRHTWLLVQESGLDLERGDAVVYYVKAWDTDTVNGPKSGRTATQRLRFPSLSEQYRTLDTLQQRTGAQMRELDREADSMQDQFRSLRNELRRTREADWEDRRQVQQMQQQQESLAQGQKELSRKVDSLSRAMQRNDLSSPKTSKKFEELKRTVDEMQSESLQEALQKLRTSMQSQGFRRMQSSMEQTQSRLQQQQRQLDRTLDLYKQLQARLKMEELSRRAEALREQEDRIAEKTEAQIEPPAPDSATAPPRPDSSARAQPSDSSVVSPSAPDSTRRPPADSAATARPDSLSPSSPAPDSAATRALAKQQDQLAKEMEKLLDAMKEAQSDLQDTPSAPTQELRRLREQTTQQKLPQQMRQNSQTLRRNQPRRARRQQQRIQQRMQRMQSRLSQLKSQMQGRQRRMNVAGLRSALDNTLRLSKDQESLRGRVERLEADGPAVRRYAVQQKRLHDGLTTVADSLQSIAGRLPSMSQAVQKKTGDALRAMQSSTRALDQRTAEEATGAQKTAMMHLNELALLLSRLLDQMQQQQSGGQGQMSMQQAMQQLQKASGEQQKLNQQIQQFLNKAQGKRLSPNMQARRKQLARQQRRIKKQLQQMDIDADMKQRLLGDLKKIAEQMEQSAQDLQSQRHSRDLLKRQQQILTRLLNAQQSLRTQGKKQQRRGQRAGTSPSASPPGERSPSNDTDALRRDLIRALEKEYSSDYEALIKRYFELLQRSSGAAE